MTTAMTLDRLREIVRPDALSSAAHSTAGYLDLLPSPSDQPQRGAQRAMNNPAVARSTKDRGAGVKPLPTRASPRPPSGAGRRRPCA